MPDTKTPTFNYIARSMGEAVILTLAHPSTARINQFFAEQRKKIKSTSATDDIIAAQNEGRRQFFDELLISSEATSGAERVALDRAAIADHWKEHCIIEAFETLGQIKNS